MMQSKLSDERWSSALELAPFMCGHFSYIVRSSFGLACSHGRWEGSLVTIKKTWSTAPLSVLVPVLRTEYHSAVADLPWSIFWGRCGAVSDNTVRTWYFKNSWSVRTRVADTEPEDDTVIIAETPTRAPKQTRKTKRDILFSSLQCPIENVDKLINTSCGIIQYYDICE
jgi:hypothetical protein